MKEISIREITDADVEPLIRLWQSCNLLRPWNDPEQDIRFARQNINSAIFAVFIEGELVASVMTGHDGHRGWVYYLAVSPAWRKQGFGRRMLKVAEEWLRAKGVWKMHLLVRNDNAQAIDFYQRLGFKLSETVCLQKVIE